MLATPGDLIVSNVQMPGMTGVELVRTLRERGLQQPVILLTGAEAKDLCTAATCRASRQSGLSVPVNLGAIIPSGDETQWALAARADKINAESSAKQVVPHDVLRRADRLGLCAGIGGPMSLRSRIIHATLRVWGR